MNRKALGLVLVTEHSLASRPLTCTLLGGYLAHAADPIENLKHVIREQYFAGHGRETIPSARHFRIAPDTTLGVSYKGQVSSDVQDHGLSGRLDWRF